ncbi:erythromycin esterase family protein [Burkholderia territorii]|uniref:erythromycin esterase family protein n=1 Tax=Burkholderia territorii TaxID=1503055 RepID=UPI0007548661|nr:erythromycin esterase family protein [Burkholderia territorii]AOI67516.1 erythromycin esterase [Burkholderia territorii]KVQ59315.1 erythromycin esterase [Burkholderia territorii]KWA18909.1 erythromycin esterase [Burkholderia territorii]KWA30974.1 erythromycin esterase [Burkholderia territorii]KWA45110.1 erythromycin esterase [Burkholderia territorii]
MQPPKTAFLAVRALGQRMNGDCTDYDALVEMARGRDLILLGEATHGTAEFYRMRGEITLRLIAEQGFDTIAIEGDWPDVWRIDRFVQGDGTDNASSALDDFERFPVWMWRNREVCDFISALRGINATRPQRDRVGVYGLDLYSLYRSADAVIRYLEGVDPAEAALARERYAALDHVREPQAYGYAAAFGTRPAAQAGAVQQLLQLRADQFDYLARDGTDALDAQFFAEQNARVVVNAEAYYRGMFGSRLNTWNLRDAHMASTLFALTRYRVRRGGSGKVIVWAHNSHLGDARATESRRRGEWNLGQIVREKARHRALLVGFTTYTGHVSAASHWDGEVEQKWVRPAQPDSWEHLFHTTGYDRFFLPMQDDNSSVLDEALLERAIGVLYLPQTERQSHYFEAALASQFDALFHLDETAAVEPLEPTAVWHDRETSIQAL